MFNKYRVVFKSPDGEHPLFIFNDDAARPLIFVYVFVNL